MARRLLNQVGLEELLALLDPADAEVSPRYMAGPMGEEAAIPRQITHVTRRGGRAPTELVSFQLPFSEPGTGRPIHMIEAANTVPSSKFPFPLSMMDDVPPTTTLVDQFREMTPGKFRSQAKGQTFLFDPVNSESLPSGHKARKLLDDIAMMMGGHDELRKRIKMRNVPEELLLPLMNNIPASDEGTEKMLERLFKTPSSTTKPGLRLNTAIRQLMRFAPALALPLMAAMALGGTDET
jgi:hypothetical protein